MHIKSIEFKGKALYIYANEDSAEFRIKTVDRKDLLRTISDIESDTSELRDLLLNRIACEMGKNE